EFALVGPDGKDYAAARTVKAGYVYRTNPRTLPGSAKGYKWVLRDSATKKVLKNSPADNGRITIVEGDFRVGAGVELPNESRLALVTNPTAITTEFALVGPDGKDYGDIRSVQPGKDYQTSNRTLPEGSARGYKWVVRDPDTKEVLKQVPAE